MEKSKKLENFPVRYISEDDVEKARIKRIQGNAKQEERDKMINKLGDKIHELHNLRESTKNRFIEMRCNGSIEVLRSLIKDLKEKEGKNVRKSS